MKEHNVSAVEINAGKIAEVSPTDAVVAMCQCGWRSSKCVSESLARIEYDAHVSADALIVLDVVPGLP